MRVLLFWLGLLTLITLSFALSTTELDDIARRYTKRTENGIHLPIVRQETSSIQRRGQVGTIGLGDYVDVTYNILVTVGGITTPVVLDTGSADLWILSSACTVGCTGTVALYPQSTFQSAGLDAQLLYGDSQTGTYAYGLIGKDKVDLAGLTLTDQYFAAINKTNTSITETGFAGIFGLGFPINSVLWSKVFVNEMSNAVVRKRSGHVPTLRHRYESGGNFAARSVSGIDFHRPTFPSLSDIFGPAPSTSSQNEPRQVSTSTLSSRIFESYQSLAPFLPRFVANGNLSSPTFAVTLQRDSVDIGGNVGQLSIGELPDGVKNDSLTWVPIRAYSRDQGGLSPPPESPNEVYPVAWEVFIDDVFLDGERLARSTLSTSTISLSALIDTGNSLIRGPADVVTAIETKLGGTQFLCSQPHTLAFQIGGKMFPVDPRDLIRQAFEDNASACKANVVATDPPQAGGYLFSWSLGMPFLKSVLSAYHFGNLSAPSQDPPGMGFLSTVPTDAGDKLKAVVAVASQAGGGFASTSQAAPSGTPVPAKTNSNGVPEASQTASGGKMNGAAVALKTLQGWPLLLLAASLTGAIMI